MLNQFKKKIVLGGVLVALVGGFAACNLGTGSVDLVKDLSSDDVANLVQSGLGSELLGAGYFEDHLYPLIARPLTDGTRTNSVACIFCHSTSSVAARTARKSAYRTATRDDTTSNVSGASFTTAKGYPTVLGEVYDWEDSSNTPRAICEHMKSAETNKYPDGTSLPAGTIRKTIGTGLSDSRLLAKIGSTGAGNMPQVNGSENATAGNYKNNFVRMTAAQVAMFQRWIEAGAPCE